jgi:hypothetical protein
MIKETPRIRKARSRSVIFKTLVDKHIGAVDTMTTLFLPDFPYDRRVNLELEASPVKEPALLG